MNEKKFWLTLGGVTGAVACIAGYLIHNVLGDIEDGHAEVARLRAEIKTSRDTIAKTPEIEREVIVLREIADRVREILPDTEDLNNVLREFDAYAEAASIQVSEYTKKSINNRGRQAGAFEKVAYELNLAGDAFQFLDFINKLETHRRFLTVPKFNVIAASRRELEEDGIAKHRIRMDVETYKYVPTGASEGLTKINGYERKRDLLSGEIARRRQALTLKTFRYRGPRGRRDPLIDPRVPSRPDDPNAWTVQRQQEEVDELVRRMAEAQQYWDASNVANSVLERMVQRQELEKNLALLEDDLRRLESEGRINYKPAEKRLVLNVVDPLHALRLQLDQSRPDSGPTIAEMQVVGDSMADSIARADYGYAIDAYRGVEDSLPLVDEDDEERQEYVQWIETLHEDATTLRDFGKIELSINGVAILEDRDPVIVIDGRHRAIGDAVGDELIVHDVRLHEVDFVFRGAVLTREF